MYGGSNVWTVSMVIKLLQKAYEIGEIVAFILLFAFMVFMAVCTISLLAYPLYSIVITVIGVKHLIIKLIIYISCMVLVWKIEN